MQPLVWNTNTQQGTEAPAPYVSICGDGEGLFDVMLTLFDLDTNAQLLLDF